MEAGVPARLWPAGPGRPGQWLRALTVRPRGRTDRPPDAGL